MRLLILFLFLSVTSSCAFAGPLLQSNDRVAIIGNTFVERARLYGHIDF